MIEEIFTKISKFIQKLLKKTKKRKEKKRLSQADLAQPNSAGEQLNLLKFEMGQGPLDTVKLLKEKKMESCHEALAHSTRLN